MLLGARNAMCGCSYDSGLIQEFRPTSSSFDGTRNGQVFDVSDALKVHLKELKDTTVIVNFRAEIPEVESNVYLPGFFLNDKVSAVSGNPVDANSSPLKFYCRDGILAKWLYFQTTSALFFHKDATSWWGKTTSIAIVASGSSVSFYVNGSRYNTPDRITYINRNSTEVRDKMIIPYSGEKVESGVKTYIHYKGDMYNASFYNHAMSASEIDAQLKIDEDKFGIKFGI